MSPRYYPHLPREMAPPETTGQAADSAVLPSTGALWTRAPAPGSLALVSPMDLSIISQGQVSGASYRFSIMGGPWASTITWALLGAF